MSKKNYLQKGAIKTKNGVQSGNRRWTASRLESVVKNRGTKMVRKPKKS